MTGDTVQLVMTAVGVPPADIRHIGRERLLSRLDELASSRVVYVRAPAGFGKTSLLADWARRQSKGRRIAWLSLSDRHANAHTLLRYVITALRSCCGPIGEATLTLLGANLPVSIGSLVTTFVNELAGLTEDTWIILDDVHCIGEQDAAASILELVRHAPLKLHFVLASREVAPFPVGRLRELGQLGEVHAQELEFTRAEVEAFLEHEALSLNHVETEHLTTNTGGWAAGLRLAAISIRDQTSPTKFLETFSGGHAAIAEFLQEDVLSRQPEELRRFLEESAQLDELNAPLCDYALERNDSAAQMHTAHERGLFLSTTDPQGSNFRYHRMFADHLRHRMEQRDADRSAMICARASQWYAQRGEDYQAIDYAFRAKDEKRAAQLLEDASERLFSSGQLDLLRNFAERVPGQLLDECPRLLLDLIWIHTLCWESRAAESLMRRVHAFVARRNDVVSPSLAEKILHRQIMMAMLRDDLDETEAVSERWPIVSTGNNNYFDGSAETCMLLIRRERFDCRSVAALAPRVRKRFVDAGAEYGTVWFDSLIAPARLMEGESERAVQDLNRAVRTAERICGPDNPLIAMPALLLGEVLYERGETDACREIVEAWLPFADRIGFVDQLIAGYVCAVRLSALSQDYSESLRLLAQGEALASEFSFQRLSAHLAAERIRLLLAVGHLREARDLLESDPILQRRSLLPGKLASISDAVVAMAHARVAHGTTAADKLIKVLRTWVNYVEGRGCVRYAIAMRGVLATLLYANNDRVGSWRVLRVAVEQSRASGIVQPLTEDGRRMLGVLDFAANMNCDVGDGIAETVDALRRTLAGETKVAGPDSVRTRIPPDTVWRDPLTVRQREILSCIADGSSNKEAANRLGVSEATVKWHLRLAYDKLGVHRRVAAVREARALGIIP